MVSELEFEFTSCPSCYADEFPWHTSQRLAAEIDDDAEVVGDDDGEVMQLMMMIAGVSPRSQGPDTKGKDI